MDDAPRDVMTEHSKILVVEEEESLLYALQDALQRQGFDVRTASDGRAARQWLSGPKEAWEPDGLLLGMDLADCQGLDLLREARVSYPHVPIIMMTGEGSIAEAVAALHNGASDYILKPFRLEEITERLKRRSARSPSSSGALGEIPSDAEFVLGTNPAMQLLAQQIDRIAAAPHTSVLILGETGVGKELVARRIHQVSARREKPFVAVNAAAFSKELLESELFGHEAGAFTGAQKLKKGLFEAADQGTLFLDEIGEMEMAMQSKLLRALQERAVRRVGGVQQHAVDVRFIAATNQPLIERVEAGCFRADLFYRLAVVTLVIPPLRERREDLPHIARHWVQRLCVELQIPHKQITEDALALLATHRWPGNIRELRNCLERALLLECNGPCLEAKHLRW